MLRERKWEWADFKSTVIGQMKLTYDDHESNTAYYILVAVEPGAFYHVCEIEKGTADATEYENSYQAEANQPLISFTQKGKMNVLSSSRPLGTETSFTTCGDDLVTPAIGEGDRLEWDFSNNTNDITAPSGFKRKRIEVGFLDPIYLKEGTIYFHNKLKGSYGEVSIVCPTGGYYYDNAGNLTQATQDTIVHRYVNRHPMQGTVPMGDELNTEETQENPLPVGYKLRVEITVPDTDSTSNGVVEFESYRARTVIL